MTAVPEYHYCRALAENLPFVLLDDRDEILFVSSPAAQYFIDGKETAGSPALAGIDPAMQTEVGATLARTRQTGLIAHSHAVPVKSGGNETQVRVSTQMLTGDNVQSGTIVLILDVMEPGDPEAYAADRI